MRYQMTPNIRYQASINILTSVWSTSKSEQRVSIPSGLLKMQLICQNMFIIIPSLISFHVNIQIKLHSHLPKLKQIAMGALIYSRNETNRHRNWIKAIAYKLPKCKERKDFGYFSNPNSKIPRISSAANYIRIYSILTQSDWRSH